MFVMVYAVHLLEDTYACQIVLLLRENEEMFMGQVLDYEDEQKLKVLQRSREESIKQEIRGLFNLDFGTANSSPKGPAD